MNNTYSTKTPQTPLSRSLLAGLASGIVALIINLIYDYIYVSITKMSFEYSIINVETIIFFSMIAGVVAGLLFHFFVYTMAKGIRTYMLTATILTIAGVLAGLAIKRSNETSGINVFRGLYAGIIIITGVCASYLLPWLIKHKNPFFSQSPNTKEG